LDPFWHVAGLVVCPPITFIPTQPDTSQTTNPHPPLSLFMISQIVKFDKLFLVYRMNSGLLEDIARCG
jgi:hypothetical protein